MRRSSETSGKLSSCTQKGWPRAANRSPKHPRWWFVTGVVGLVVLMAALPLMLAYLLLSSIPAFELKWW